MLFTIRFTNSFSAYSICDSQIHIYFVFIQIMIREITFISMLFKIFIEIHIYFDFIRMLFKCAYLIDLWIFQDAFPITCPCIMVTKTISGDPSWKVSTDEPFSEWVAHTESPNIKNSLEKLLLDQQSNNIDQQTNKNHMIKRLVFQ